MAQGLLTSFGNALRGLVEVTARERNMKLHVLAGTAVGLLGAEVELPFASRAVLLGATAVVIGGRDADAEGTWQWIGGPDNGTQFWSGNCVAEGGKSTLVQPSGSPINASTNRGFRTTGHAVRIPAGGVGRSRRELAASSSVVPG